MRSKKIFCSILAFAISIGLFSSCSYNSNQSSQKNGKSVVVKGNSVINVKPDTAILELGVITVDKDINKIKVESNKIMDNIVDAIVKLGVNKKDIYTSSYNLNSEYTYISDTESQLSGYDLSTTISVRVRNTDKIGEIITEATKAGANINNGIVFTVSDYDKYYKEALKKAIEDGNNKAKDISKNLGVDLGSAVKIDEDQNYINYNENNNFTNANYEEKTNNVRGTDQLITASVNMTFEY